MRIVCLIFAALLTGCGETHLASIEKSSQALQECLISKVMPDECVAERKQRKLAILRAEQEGIDDQIIRASKEIGEQMPEGSPTQSPYERIKRSLLAKPFYIDPIRKNFSSYQTRCPEFDLDKEDPDHDEFADALTWIGRSRDYFQAVAFYSNRDELTVFFVKVAAPCLPEDPTKIDDQFPIITKVQLNTFNNGLYENYRYHSITTRVFDSYEAAVKEYRESSG